MKDYEMEININKVVTMKIEGAYTQIDVDSVLGLLHHVDVGAVAVSIFRVIVCRLVSFCVYIALRGKSTRVGTGVLSGPVNQESYADSH
jgi:hypothetical protein